jgi:hypothetical protein
MFPRRSVLVLLLGLGSQAVALGDAEPPLSPAERQQVEQLATTVESQCATALSKIPDVANVPEALRGLAPSGRDTGYCACIAAGVREGMTPALIRHGTPQQDQEFLHTTASQCAVARFKQDWPRVCHAMAGVGAQAGQQGKVDAACACTQPRVDALTADNLAETTRQTVEDYTDYAHGGDLHPGNRPLSLLTPLKACLANPASKP